LILTNISDEGDNKQIQGRENSCTRGIDCSDASPFRAGILLRLHEEFDLDILISHYVPKLLWTFSGAFREIISLPAENGRIYTAVNGI